MATKLKKKPVIVNGIKLKKDLLIRFAGRKDGNYFTTRWDCKAKVISFTSKSIEVLTYDDNRTYDFRIENETLIVNELRFEKWDEAALKKERIVKCREEINKVWKKNYPDLTFEELFPTAPKNTL